MQCLEDWEEHSYRMWKLRKDGQPIEPAPQMMICEKAQACYLPGDKCKFRSAHKCGPICHDHPWCRSITGKLVEVHCIPVPAPVNLPPPVTPICDYQGKCSSQKGDPAPVREIERGAIQWHIKSVKKCYTQRGPLLNRVLTDLESLVDGKAVIVRKEK